ncbi:CMGC CDK CDC2 kinase [Fusarium oxysporum]|nr:CMGC CDK CDC2 kinase [Fusarium oxysporum]
MLISRDVGLTPVIAMLKMLVNQVKSRKIAFIHAVKNGRVYAIKTALWEIITNNPQVSHAIFYKIINKDRQGFDYDCTGRVGVSRIKDMMLLPGADYYICGPLPLIKAQSKALMSMGVNEGHIRMELFGSSRE